MSIEPTLTLADAATGHWDVLVVGAGPAGALAAREIARLGNAVLLVDKSDFPRTKVCGCCLNRDSQSSLRAAGLENLTSRLNAVPIRQFRIGAHRSRMANLPLAGSVCLSRTALDAALIRSAIEQGVEFLPRTQARLNSLHGDRRVVHLRSASRQTEISAPVLLAADGLGSGLMAASGEVDSVIRSDSRIGAGMVIDADIPQYQPGTIYMACGRHGYVGLVRLEDSRLDVAAALDRGPLKRLGGIGPMIAGILSDAGFPGIAGLDGMQWKGTLPLTRTTVRPWAHRTFLIGDAAGYVEPFTGEGIAWALASGLAVAPLASRAVVQWNPSLGEAWSGQYRQLIRSRQWRCRAWSGDSVIRF